MRALFLSLAAMIFPLAAIQAKADTILVKNERLVLYYMPTCPYCKPVLKKIQKKNIPVVLKNISSDSKARKQLIAVGGKAQVPCLFINGQPLYESGAILKWLDKNYP